MSVGCVQIFYRRVALLFERMLNLELLNMSYIEQQKSSAESNQSEKNLILNTVILSQNIVMSVVSLELEFNT